MADTKRIAMIVRDRQGEALRVAGGLTLVDDIVDVFILDRVLDRSDPEVLRPLELVTELDLKVYSNNSANNGMTVTLEQMAKQLLEYDIVIPY